MARTPNTIAALANICDALEHLEAAIEHAIVGHLDGCGQDLKLAREERKRVERAIKPPEPTAAP